MWDIHINKMKKDNKEIYIYDNVFPTHHTQKFYNFISTSYFTISFNDSECKDYPHPKLLGASYSKTDIENIEILKLLPKNIKDKFNTSIPHLIRPSTQSAPPYRFSINMTFK